MEPRPIRRVGAPPGDPVNGTGMVIAGAFGLLAGAVAALAWNPPIIHVRLQFRPRQDVPRPGELLHALPYSRGLARHSRGEA